MHLHVRFADGELRRFENMVGALGEQKARVGMVRAVSRITNMVKTRAVREIVRQSGIPRKIVLQSIKVIKPTQKGSGPIEGHIIANGRPVSLREFKPVQFKWGVRVKAWGQWQRYEGSFIHGGRWNSGKLAFKGHVMTRVGKARFPVRRENGPSVPAEMIRGASAVAFEELVRTKLPERALHEMSRLLNA
jgi:hypothetical protein